MASRSLTSGAPPPSPAERRAGGLIGLLVGDALGVPYEFHPPQALPRPEHIEFEPPTGFLRSHPGIPPGTWSDDGAQALALLDTLLEHGTVDLAGLSRRLQEWRERGRYAVDGQVFDIGLQTAAALDLLARGCPPEASGGRGERDNGNGSLMRVLPLALWSDGDDEALVRSAMQQSLPTHAHPRSATACAQACLFARALLAGEPPCTAWTTACNRLRALASTVALPLDEIDIVLDPAHSQRVRGTGYVVDSLWSARACLLAGADFEGVVRRAVALGHDTDTTAAIAGGLAGIRFGLQGIPARWRQGLRGMELVQPLLQALLARSA